MSGLSIFACDVIAAGQRFRVLGVIDSFTHRCLALETATSFPNRRVTRVLERAIQSTTGRNRFAAIVGPN